MKLIDDEKLLRLMIKLANFRGSSRLVVMSYADNLVLDARFFYRICLKKNFARFIVTIFRFDVIFNSLVKLTAELSNMCNVYATEILKFKPGSQYLLSRYTVKNSSVALFTSDEYNADSTIIHTKLPEYFKNRKFEHFEHEMLFNSNRKNYFFLSNKQ